MGHELQPYHERINRLHPVRRMSRWDLLYLYPNAATVAFSFLGVVLGALLGVVGMSMFSSTLLLLGFIGIIAGAGAAIAEQPWMGQLRRDQLSGGALSGRTMTLNALEDPVDVDQWAVMVERGDESVFVRLVVEDESGIRVIEERGFDPDDGESVITSHEYLAELTARAVEENEAAREDYLTHLEKLQRIDELAGLLEEQTRSPAPST